jgi:hypothetical protein
VSRSHRGGGRSPEGWADDWPGEVSRPHSVSLFVPSVLPGRTRAYTVAALVHDRQAKLSPSRTRDEWADCCELLALAAVQRAWDEEHDQYLASESLDIAEGFTKGVKVWNTPSIQAEYRRQAIERALAYAQISWDHFRTLKHVSRLYELTEVETREAARELADMSAMDALAAGGVGSAYTLVERSHLEWQPTYGSDAATAVGIAVETSPLSADS